MLGIVAAGILVVVAVWAGLLAAKAERHATRVPGIPNDHGRRKSHAYWTKRGFSSRSPAACRTFLASSAVVR